MFKCFPRRSLARFLSAWIPWSYESVSFNCVPILLFPPGPSPETLPSFLFSLPKGASPWWTLAAITDTKQIRKHIQTHRDTHIHFLLNARGAPHCVWLFATCTIMQRDFFVWDNVYNIVLIRISVGRGLFDRGSKAIPSPYAETEPTTESPCGFELFHLCLEWANDNKWAVKESQFSTLTGWKTEALFYTSLQTVPHSSRVYNPLDWWFASYLVIVFPGLN